MPLASVKLAGRSEVTVVWARTCVAEKVKGKTSAATRQAAKRCEDIMTCCSAQAENFGQAAAPYTVQLSAKRYNAERLPRLFAVFALGRIVDLVDQRLLRPAGAIGVVRRRRLISRRRHRQRIAGRLAFER